MQETEKKYEEIKFNTEYKGIKIGQWKNTQRQKYKEGKLSQEEELRLRELGETFDIKKILSFEEMIEIIKEYMQETEKKYEEIKFNTEYKGIKIGLWKNRQRKKYRERKLSQEEELILRELGEVFPNVHRIPEGSTTLVKDINLTIPSKTR